MNALGRQPAAKPATLSMQATRRGGFIVTADGTKVYLTDEPEVWALMSNHVDPRLNVPPIGNC